MNANMLAATYIIGAFIGLVFLVWLHTKPGKKWKENL